MAYRISQVEAYRKTAEISSSLAIDATLALCHEKYNWRGIIPECEEIDRLYIEDYRRVCNDLNAMQAKMKEFEFKHWMGFADEDVAHLLQEYEAFNSCAWDGKNPEREDYLRKLWNPGFDEENRFALWEPYFSRRVRTPLQKSIDDINGWGSAELPGMTVKLGSTAGRVLLTLQDRHPQGHPESKYGGAWISLIFDETAKWPRGGIQGQCATRDEAVGLIQAVIDEMPILKHDKTLAIG